jgi:hypothetical protein
VLFAAAPLRTLRLVRARPNFPARVLAGFAPLARLRTLELAGDLPDYCLLPLLTSPHVAGLKGLRISGYRLGDDGLARLLAGPFPPVEDLDLRYNRLTAAGVRTLAGWPALSGVRSLNLSTNSFGSDGVRALDGIPTGVRRLALRGCSLGAGGLAALSRWPGLSGLESLDLGINQVGDTALAEFLPALPGVASLDLALNGLDGRSARVLAAWSGLRSVRRLGLERNEWSVDAHHTLAFAPGLGQLVELRIDAPTREHLAAWTASPALRGLRELTVTGPLTDGRARVLLESSLPPWLLVRPGHPVCEPGLLATLQGRFDVEL